MPRWHGRGWLAYAEGMRAADICSGCARLEYAWNVRAVWDVGADR